MVNSKVVSNTAYIAEGKTTSSALECEKLFLVWFRPSLLQINQLLFKV